MTVEMAQKVARHMPRINGQFAATALGVLDKEVDRLREERDDWVKALDENWVQHQRVVKAEKETTDLRQELMGVYNKLYIVESSRDAWMRDAARLIREREGAYMAMNEMKRQAAKAAK